jgi:hypothetical protein
MAAPAGVPRRGGGPRSRPGMHSPETRLAGRRLPGAPPRGRDPERRFRPRRRFRVGAGPRGTGRRRAGGRVLPPRVRGRLADVSGPPQGMVRAASAQLRICLSSKEIAVVGDAGRRERTVRAHRSGAPDRCTVPVRRRHTASGNTAQRIAVPAPRRGRAPIRRRRARGPRSEREKRSRPARGAPGGSSVPDQPVGLRAWSA